MKENWKVKLEATIKVVIFFLLILGMMLAGTLVYASVMWFIHGSF